MYKIDILVNYKGFDLVIDPDTNFCMLEHCYYNGNNCYNCNDDCPCEEIDEDLIQELAEK